MPGAQDGLQRLRDYSGHGYSAYEYVSDASESDLQIDHGLIFLMAFWSGPAIVGFKNLCDALQTIALPKDFVFRVLDWDGATQFIEQLNREDVIAGGNAEAYWYRHGEVFAGSYVANATPERIRELVDEIAKQ